MTRLIPSVNRSFSLGLLCLLTFLAFSTSAQVGPDRYFIQFTDKANSPYSIDQPLEFLSQGALDRRELHGVAVTAQDIPVNRTYIDSILSSGAVRIVNVSKWFNGITIFCNDSALVEDMKMYSFVREVRSAHFYETGVDQIDKLETLDNMEKCDDLTPYYDKYYGFAYNQIKMLNGHWLHDDGYQGEGVKVAVMDAGYLQAFEIEAHDKLFDEGRVLGEKDFILGDLWVFNHSAHGTYVLSTMAGDVPGTYVGTAPKASYFLLRTEDPDREYVMEEYAWVAGAEYADSAGVDVINTSLGYTTFEDSTQNHTYDDLDGDSNVITIGADIAAAKGMIVVVSAGNSGQGAWYYIGSPGDADSVLTVGAVDSFGVSAGFSSHGPSADGRVKPNVAAQGGPATVATPNGNYFAGNGTSFSSPITAGLMACLRQAHPDKTNMELIDAVERSASQYDNPDDNVGYGVPNFYLAHLMLKGESETQTEDNLMLAYPNPIEDELRLLVYSTKDQKGIVEIFDEAGRQVYSAETTLHANEYCNIRIDGNPVDWHQGIYIVRVETESGSYTQKLVKSN